MASAGLVAADSNSTNCNANNNVSDIEEGLRRCRACASSALIVDWAAGDRVCTNCGVVDEERLLEDRPEWREFDDDNDRARNAGAGMIPRCGLVANSESKWIGGLQPTSLSKHVYGRPTATSSSSRKKLVTANQRMDRIMEKKHAKDVESVKLSLLIRKRRLEQRKRAGHLDEDGEDGLEEELNESSLRPELEQLLVHEEETAIASAATLHADKWSLDRAIRLFGGGHEVSSLPSSAGNNNNESQEDLEQLRSNETLSSAARDLYTAYSMLIESANRLQLPDRVANEATATLCKYAARRDGLNVRGVSSQLKKKQPSNQKTSKKNTSSARARNKENKAREALREFNKYRQMGSLVSALLFYTSRSLNFPRSLVQVCTSIETPTSVQSNPHLDLDKDSSFIKKKHCSKAMNEIKQTFPDFARGAPSGASINEQPTPASMMNDTTTTSESMAEHIARKLRLPPVAEAAVRALVLANQEENNEKEIMDTKKRFAVCAAISHFVCQMGDIMQNLARQASDADIARKKRRASGSSITKNSKKPKLEKNASKLVKTEGGPEQDNPEGAEVCDIFSQDEESSFEQKQYEMRRVWDAWREQTGWNRSASEIEQASGVSLSSIETQFKTTIYPKKKLLLQALIDKSRISVADSSSIDGGLSKVPLASVLLPHILVAEPLLEETVRPQTGCF